MMNNKLWFKLEPMTMDMDIEECFEVGNIEEMVQKLAGLADCLVMALLQYAGSKTEDNPDLAGYARSLAVGTQLQVSIEELRKGVNELRR